MALGAPDSSTAATEPTVEGPLQTDRVYRERADRGDLRVIAPRRFNPERRVAPGASSRTGWMVTNGHVLQHGPRTSTRANGGLGRHLLRAQRRRRAMHGCL